jgi:type IX secretion system PorP/SprF family membrane protein
MKIETTILTYKGLIFKDSDYTPQTSFSCFQMKTLKTIISLFIIFQIINLKANAQENVRLSQYFQNAQFYNPAFSGVESFLDIKLAHKQNFGAYEFAPKTSLISVSAPFNASPRRSTELYSLRISNPKLYSKLSNGAVQPVKHGIGGVLLNERLDAFSLQTAMITYSFHVSIQDKVNLSIGVSPYYFRSRVDVDMLHLEEDGTNGTREDEVMEKYRTNNLLYNRAGVNTGLLLYSDKFYLGYSAQGAYQKNLSMAAKLDEDNSTSKNKIMHSLMGGYKVDLNESLVFLPGFYINYKENRPLLYSVNTKIAYENKYWGGLAYATSGSLSLIAGMKMNNLINISYSYDYTIKGMSNYMSGSHELIIGFMLVRNGSNRSYMW